MLSFKHYLIFLHRLKKKILLNMYNVGTEYYDGNQEILQFLHNKIDKI